MLVHKHVKTTNRIKTLFHVGRDMQVFAGNPCRVNDKMFQQDAQHFFFQVVVYLKFALQAGDDGLASCFFFFRKAEVHDAGGTIEKESAT